MKANPAKHPNHLFAKSFGKHAIRRIAEKAFPEFPQQQQQQWPRSNLLPLRVPRWSYLPRMSHLLRKTQRAKLTLINETARAVGRYHGRSLSLFLLPGDGWVLEVATWAVVEMRGWCGVNFGFFLKIHNWIFIADYRSSKKFPSNFL